MDLKVDGYVPRPGEEPIAEILQVSPGYFATLGMTIREGRDFDEMDFEGSPRVVAISESLALAYFLDGAALGGRILIDDDEWATVIAVIGDVWYRSGTRRAPAVYEPYAISGRRGSMGVLAKVDGSPESLVPAVSEAVTAIDPEVAVYGIGPLEKRLWDAISGPRLRTLLVGVFSLLSLLLSVTGVYGVMAYMVGQRFRELSIRRVLGAPTMGIFRYVLRRGLLLTCLGTGLGLIGSIQAVEILRTYLYELEPQDPLTITLAVGVLGGAALLACAVPALRATKVDPVVALKAE